MRQARIKTSLCLVGCLEVSYSFDGMKSRRLELKRGIVSTYLWFGHAGICSFNARCFREYGVKLEGSLKKSKGDEEHCVEVGIRQYKNNHETIV